MATFGTFVDGVSLKASELNSMLASTSFLPTLRQGGTTITPGSIRAGGYMQVNDLVIGWFTFLAGGSGGSGSRIEVDLPVTAASTGPRVIGSGWFFDSGGADPIRLLRVVQYSTTAMAFLTAASTSPITYLGTVGGPQLGIASGDWINGSFMYRAA